MADEGVFAGSGGRSPEDDVSNCIAHVRLDLVSRCSPPRDRYSDCLDQRVSVTHQHVNVNADKAAVAVNAPGGPGALVKSEERPDEPGPDQIEQIAYAPGDPMPSALKTHESAVLEPGR